VRQCHARVVSSGRLCRHLMEVGKGLVTFGSAADYGAPNGLLTAEAGQPHATSQYGRSKLAATHVVLITPDSIVFCTQTW
jgi:nucleoside-diphosphate-sugar epimerase